MSDMSGTDVSMAAARFGNYSVHGPPGIYLTPLGAGGVLLKIALAIFSLDLSYSDEGLHPNVNPLPRFIVFMNFP